MRIFPLVGLGVALSGSAFAAESPKASSLGQSEHDWSGVYVGANVGYGRNHADVADTFSAPGFGALGTTTHTSLSMNGAIGGGQIGYNLQRGRIVFGLEGDFQSSGQRDKHPYGCDVGGASVPGCTVYPNDQIQWFATLRARAGITKDRWLLYGSVGPAWQNLHSSGVVTISGVGSWNVFSSSTTRTGYALSSGVEGAVNDRWSVGLEYLRIDTGRHETANISLPSGLNAALGGPPGTAIDETHRLTDNIVRLKVNFRF